MGIDISFGKQSAKFQFFSLCVLVGADRNADEKDGQVKRAALVLVSFAVVAALIFPFWQTRDVTGQVARVTQGDPFCFFDGHYIQGDVPAATAQSPESNPVQVFSDIRDRYLNSEQAKPFHFGILVFRPDGAREVHGWSYWRADFWPTDDAAVYFGQVSTITEQCEGRL